MCYATGCFPRVQPGWLHRSLLSIGGGLSTAALIEIEGLTKRYGDVTAVEDVSFAVGGDRIVGLLGHNGAGKTTTLWMLLGLAWPTAGRATVFGHPYADLPRAVHRIGVSVDGIGPSSAATTQEGAMHLAGEWGLQRLVPSVGRFTIDEAMPSVCRGGTVGVLSIPWARVVTATWIVVAGVAARTLFLRRDLQ